MAVTANQVVDKRDEGGLIAIPVKSGETIYQNTIVAVGSDGYLYNLDSAAVPAASIVGIVADDSINTSGPAATTASGSISGTLVEGSAAAGDKTVRLVWTKGKFKLTLGSITQAMVGTTMYATDNFTVDDTQISGVALGTLVTYISTTSGYVAINEFMADRASGLRMIRGALSAATGTTGGAVLSVANPTGKTCMIERMVLDVTTGCTSSQTVDVGVAANGTTTSDTLLDGVGTLATVYDNITDAGTNGGATVKWTTTQYVTGTASAALTNLVGNYGIFYRLWV